MVTDKITVIKIYDVDDFSIFPHDKLFPNEELFPQFKYMEIGTDMNDVGIVSGTLKLSEIAVDNDFSFGTVCSNKFEVQLFNANFKIAGKVIEVMQRENGVYTQLFKGVIDSAKSDRMQTYRSIVAYDMFYYLRDKDVSDFWNTFWDKHLTNNIYSATLKQIRTELLTYVGLEYEDIELTNDNLVISKVDSFSVLSFADLLKSICEMQACIPHINRFGKVEFVQFDISGKVHDLTGLYEGDNSQWQDLAINPITGISVYNGSEELLQVYGTATNTYKINGNLFILAMKSANELNNALAPIYNILKEVTFVPATIKMITADYDLRLGDKILTERGYSYVFKSEYSGILLLEQTLSCTATSTTQPDSVSAGDQRVQGRKLSVVKHDLDGLKSEVADLDTNVSSLIQQTENEVLLKVDNNGNIVQVKLGVDPNDSSATVYDISSDKIKIVANSTIDISGKSVKLKADNIDITGGTMNWNNKFIVNAQGGVTCTDLTINGGSINIAGVFSVSKSGYLSCSGATLSGTLYLDNAIYLTAPKNIQSETIEYGGKSYVQAIKILPELGAGDNPILNMGGNNLSGINYVSSNNVITDYIDCININGYKPVTCTNLGHSGGAQHEIKIYWSTDNRIGFLVDGNDVGMIRTTS